jgi:hypothetical protein
MIKIVEKIPVRNVLKCSVWRLAVRYGHYSGRQRVKDMRGYSHLKEEALDRTMWRNCFGRGFGPVVRQNTD